MSQATRDMVEYEATQNHTIFMAYLDRDKKEIVRLYKLYQQGRNDCDRQKQERLIIDDSSNWEIHHQMAKAVYVRLLSRIETIFTIWKGVTVNV